jgi:seryl-tRNA synthetase
MEINLQNEILKREQLIEQNENKKHKLVELKTLVESTKVEISALIEQIDNFNADEILSEIKIIKGIMESAGEDEQVVEENPKVVEQVEEIAEEIVEQEVEQVEEIVEQEVEIVAEEIPVGEPEEQPKEIETPKPQMPKIRPFPFRR